MHLDFKIVKHCYRIHILLNLTQHPYCHQLSFLKKQAAKDELCLKSPASPLLISTHRISREMKWVVLVIMASTYFCLSSSCNGSYLEQRKRQLPPCKRFSEPNLEKGKTNIMARPSFWAKQLVQWHWAASSEVGGWGVAAPPSTAPLPGCHLIPHSPGLARARCGEDASSREPLNKCI